MAFESSNTVLHIIKNLMAMGSILWKLLSRDQNFTNKHTQGPFDKFWFFAKNGNKIKNYIFFHNTGMQ